MEIEDENGDGDEDDNLFLYIWHFDMLQDEERNVAYRKAISHYVNKFKKEKGTCKCLDIGAGSGLLGLICKKEGASNVISFEAVPELAKVAIENVKLNHYESSMEIINKHSTSEKYPLNKENRFDLLVCELLDTGLIGEGPLISGRHALCNFLKEDSVIIPADAQINFAIIDSDVLWKRRQYENPNVCFPEEITSCSGTPGPESVNVQIFINQNLIKYLSAINDGFYFDFYNIPSKSGRSVLRNVEMKEDGNAHCVLVWWNANLCKEENIFISTQPGTSPPRDHWRQALYFFPKAIKVQKGQVMALQMNHDDDDLWFKFDHLNNDGPPLSSSPEIHDADESSRCVCTCNFHILNSPNKIWSLNTEYKSFEKYLNKELLLHYKINNFFCVDLTDGPFLSLSLSMLYKKQCLSEKPSCKIICIEKSNESYSLSSEISIFNKQSDVITIVKDEDFDVPSGSINWILSDSVQSSVESLWAESSTILYWLQINTLREAGKINNDKCVYTPRYAKIRFCLIQCSSLRKRLGIVSNECQGVNVSAMNRLHVGYHTIHSLNMSEFDYTILSDVYDLLTIDYKLPFDDIPTYYGVSKGDCDGICSGVIMWVDYYSDLEDAYPIISTGLNEDYSPNANIQGLYLFEKEKNMNKGDVLEFSCYFSSAKGKVVRQFKWC